MRNLLLEKIIYSVLILLIASNVGFGIDIEKLLEQRVSPSFERVMLKDALRIFANQNNFNYVFTGEGKELVTVRLTNVPIKTALEYILKPYGYHYLIKDDVMIIKPLKNDLYGELKTKIYHLQYIDGLKIKETVNKFLSGKGKLEALLVNKTDQDEPDRSNILIVSDLEENLKIIDQIIEELDSPVKQVLIEVRLIETLIGDNQQFGLQWPTSVSASVMGAETSAPISQQGQQSQGGNQTVLSGWLELPETPNQLHLGVLTIDKLQAALDLLASDNHSRLISNPKITTVNNQKAIIRIGTTVPIPEIQRSVAGDLYSYKEKDVSMSLEVIPVIGEDNKINLKLHPVMQEIIGYTGAADAPQPIVSVREVETSVVINDGETVAIGGLVKESRSEQQEGIWLLSSIPVLGYLFKHTTIRKEKNDLLIFITSKVLESK